MSLQNGWRYVLFSPPQPPTHPETTPTKNFGNNGLIWMKLGLIKGKYYYQYMSKCYGWGYI